MAIDEPEAIEPAEYVSAREEALFARDLDGQLIRYKESTIEDLTTDVRLTIDGEPVTVKKALPLRNSQGVIQCNAQGEVIPRATTIYDAVTKKYVKLPEDANPIAILCHREHQKPIGVCRVCLVLIQEPSKDVDTAKKKEEPRGALVSSCTTEVMEGMVVTTSACQGDEKQAKVVEIKAAVGMMVELLASEHLTQTDMEEIRLGLPANEPNELKRLVQQFVLPAKQDIRFKPSENHNRRGNDKSSPMISVNHNACIQCQRCTRACNDIKQNYVIGRTGKGYQTKISFDLDVEMLESSCVSCGECVISCPTDALTFKPTVLAKHVEKILERSVEGIVSRNQISAVAELRKLPIFSGSGLTLKPKAVGENADKVKECLAKSGIDFPTVEEMRLMPIFRWIPEKFLKLNGGACVRRHLEPNDVLMRQGEFGSTAFLIESGKFEIKFDQPKNNGKNAPNQSKTGTTSSFWSFLTKSKSAKQSSPQHLPTLATGSDSVDPAAGRSERIFRDKEDLILGEVACLSRKPRGATVVAVEPSVVIEIGTNVLYMLQRNESSRKLINEAYQRHELNSQLENLPIFESLSREARVEAAKILKENVVLASVEPGQPIFKQGEMSDEFYIVRLGHVKVSRKNGNREQVVDYIGPVGRQGSVGFFGETSPLSVLYKDELREDFERYQVQPGIRTATCSALDHVELVQIKCADLKRLTDSNPKFKEYLLKRTRHLLEVNATTESELSTSKSSFVEQGLYNAQSLLVLDLESCTRCDECTKACADAHDGNTRLIREGLRFEHFLVATSCRSCTDPYCLVGCPVNAIFRQGTHEIVIEDHCIGCGLCASNCPYGNITMYGHDEEPESDGDCKIPVIQQRATTCDQCKSIGGSPRCVYACPHHAAHRMTGTELEQLVLTRRGENLH